MGATGVAYEIAETFGINIVTPRPALVPLTLGGQYDDFKSISGVAVPSVARTQEISFQEASLFTHRGLSGPAILQVSSYWRQGDPVWINVLKDAGSLLRQAKQDMPRAHLKAALSEHLPKRLVEVLDKQFGLTSQLANIPDRVLDEVASTLENMEFLPNGTEGYAKAEVTAGGVDTAELSSKTMEARKMQGLFFIGEAVDVTGWLGGYNFQWAWSSGVAAGQELGARAGL
jgi:predicted Rossmann fold flavoprotein